jgi:hypothetical protein
MRGITLRQGELSSLNGMPAIHGAEHRDRPGNHGQERVRGTWLACCRTFRPYPCGAACMQAPMMGDASGAACTCREGRRGHIG